MNGVGVAHTNAKHIEQKNIAAWILTIESDIKVAVSQYEMTHIDENPQLKKVPKSPSWCSEIMIWKDHVIPVFDFSNNMQKDSGPSGSKCIVAIMKYFDKVENSFRYGALKIIQPPVLETVNNDRSCQISSINKNWSKVIISGFYDNSEIEVAILDIESLFSRAL